MSKHSNWFRLWPANRAQRRAADRLAPPGFRPDLTRLEDRTNPAEITTTGTSAVIVLDVASELVTFSTSTAGQVSVASTGAMTLNGSGVTSPQVLTDFTSITVTDTATGTAVAFATSTVEYTASFNIGLDDSPAAVTFDGSSNFGAVGLSLSTSRNIVVNSGATLTASSASISLDGNFTSQTGTGTFNGVEVLGSVTTSGVGNVYIYGAGGSTGGKGVVVSAAVGSTGSGFVNLYGVGGSGGSGAKTGLEISGTAAVVTTISNDITLQGYGGGGTGTSSGVVVSAGATVVAGGTGDVNVTAVGGGGSGADDNYGLHVTDAGSLLNTNGGDVSVTATGGGGGTGSDSNHGVRVAAGGKILAALLGGVTITGTGGAGTSNYGVTVTGTGSAISTAVGDVSVTGVGGGSSGGSNYGVRVSAGGVISSANSGGSVAITGTGGAAGSDNYGVSVTGAGSTVSTVGGTVTITGTGGGSGGGSDDNFGVSISTGGTITAGGTGEVLLTGTGGSAGSDNDGVVVTSTNGSLASISSAGGDVVITGSATGGGYDFTVASSGTKGASVISSGGSGDLTIIADTASISGFSTLQAGTNGGRTATFFTRTAGTLVALGGSDVRTGATRTLGLTDSELDTVKSTTLHIGDENTGTITLVNNISLADSADVLLVSGGDVTFSNGGFNTGGGTLTITPGSDAGEGFSPTSSGIDATTDSLQLTVGYDLEVVIEGTAADTQHTQLAVFGTANLTGMDLALSGAYVPADGDTFTIVSASQVIGTFNGLPNGTLFTYKGVSMRIVYSDISVTLKVNRLATGVTAGGPYSIGEGQAVTLTASATDPDGDALLYSWDVNGDGVFGDEAGGSTPNYGKTLTFTVAQLVALGLGDGTTTLSNVRVRANDGGGWVTSSPTSLTIANVPPTATLTAGSSAISEGQMVGYAGSFTDPVLDGPFTYAWKVTNAGGQVVAGASGTVDTAGPVPGFVFTSADNGTYVVSLVVTDKDGGASLPATHTLVVTNLPPTIVQFTAPTSGMTGEPIAVSALATDPAGAVDPITYAWAVFKNGSPFTSGVGPNLVFTPNGNGGYSIILTVSDGDGGVATATKTVVVSGSVLPPTGSAEKVVNARFAASVSGTVWVYNPADGSVQSVVPFPGYNGEISTALSDLNGDGVPELVVGAGAGGAPHVKAFDGATGAEVLSFFAFSPAFTGGVFVAAGGGRIAVGAGAGAAPHVRVFDGAGGEVQSFFAYAPNFAGGVRVALGDLNGDGVADVVTGAGAGAAPHVRAFDGDSLAELASFFAFSPAFTGGVFVAAGGGQIAVGAGATAPHVRVFNAVTGAEVQSFFAYSSGNAGGVRVALADLDADGDRDLLTGTGPGAAPQVRGFDLPTLTELVSFFPTDLLTPTPFVPTRGVFVS